jgi:hypothetical protein
MKSFSKEDILRAPDLKVEPVEVWGGVVYVRGMTGAERDSFEASIVSIRGNKQDVSLENIRAKLCVRCVCDETGNRLFADNEADLLSGKSAVELQKLFAVAQRLSGLTTDDVSELVGVKKSPFGDSVSG